jgi:hypothetical protein
MKAKDITAKQLRLLLKEANEKLSQAQTSFQAREASYVNVQSSTSSPPISKWHQQVQRQDRKDAAHDEWAHEGRRDGSHAQHCCELGQGTAKTDHVYTRLGHSNNTGDCDLR